jgi:hypothetical protein
MTTEKNNLNPTTATATNLSVSENLKNKLQIEKNNYVTARSSRLQPGVVDKILTKIKENFKLANNEEAASILAVLFQQGGTARSCDGNMSIRIFDQDIKLAQIRKILKENSCNKGERKLARSLADTIQEVCFIMEIPGNLYNKIQKKDLKRTFTMEEKVWLSDFQSDNENCPAELRELILQTFKKEKSSKTSKKTTKSKNN